MKDVKIQKTAPDKTTPERNYEPPSRGAPPLNATDSRTATTVDLGIDEKNE